MIGVVVGGVGLLVALAMLIGVTLDREERDAAWRRIAVVRRTNAERGRDLEQEKTRLATMEFELAARKRLLDMRERMIIEREARLRSMGSDDDGSHSQPA